MSRKVVTPASPKLRPGTGAARRAREPEAGVPERPPQELLHELQVYRIELEMQNETLRQAQAALEESRDRYADLYEFAPIGYLTLGNQGQITEINLTGAELLGADRSELLQRPFAVFVAPEHRERWRQHLLQAFRHGAKQSCELGLLHGRGGNFTASLECLRSAVGNALPTLRVALTDISARWRAEQALQESETRFRAMADAAPVLIWVAGVDKGCNWFNQQWLKFTGRSMAQELDTGWIEAVHGNDRQRCLSIYHEAFDRRQPFDMEYRLRRADGQYRWIFDNGVPRYGPDQEFLGYIGSCIDITRMKHVADDLQRAQSVAHIGNWRFDVQRRQFRGSRETQRIFGIGDGAPLSYEGFLAKIHPDDRAEVDRIWHGGAQGEPYDVEHRLVIGGEVRWVRERAVLEFDAQGLLQGAFGVTQDVTQINEAKQALSESQERFRAFMTNSPVASWIVDGEGRFQYVSPIYYKMFKVPATDLVGKRISEVYPPLLAERYLSSNQEVIAAWQAIESMQPGLRADGSDGEFLVVKFPIRDAGERPMLCGMALDVTERRQALDQLREANQRLEQLATEQAAHLRELARDLTHAEQRERDRLYELLHDEVQPLLVAARLSLSGLGVRTPPQDRLRVAAEACQHISGVIDVARTLSFQLSPPLIRERGLSPALESLCHWVRDNHGLEVELSSTPEAESDDMALRLLCFNAVRELLTNTAKHAGASRAKLTVDLVDGDTLRITVADRGSGFDPATITSGSGLSAIERRLSMLGGSLQIDSRPGQGTVATLAAPLRPPGAGDRRGKSGGRDAQDTDR